MGQMARQRAHRGAKALSPGTTALLEMNDNADAAIWVYYAFHSFISNSKKKKFSKSPILFLLYCILMMKYGALTLPTFLLLFFSPNIR